MNILHNEIAKISIEQVKNNHEILLAEHFNEVERQELSTRHVRSTAGWLVLKRAICQVVTSKGFGSIDEKDILLGRNQQGRPYIKTISHPSPTIASLRDTLLVSITHSRITAYGLDVYQEV